MLRRSGGLTTVGSFLLLLALLVGGSSLTLWTMRTMSQARTAVQKILDERDKARKSEAVVRKRLEEALSVQQVLKKERDQALDSEKEALRLQKDTKTVLDFLQNYVLSAAGRPTSWSHEGMGAKVTLRQAVDRASSKIAGAYPDRPLVEAPIREVLGATYLELGEAMLAIQQYERALTLWEATLGSDDSATSDCRNKLAVAYRLTGRSDEAGRLFNHDPNWSSDATALVNQGATLLSQKKPVEAERKLRAALAIRQKKQPDDWTTFATIAMIGAALLEQKKFAEAEPLLLSGYEGMKQREAKIPSRDTAALAKSLERLVQLYEAWGKKDKASSWRSKLEKSKPEAP